MNFSVQKIWQKTRLSVVLLAALALTNLSLCVAAGEVRAAIADSPSSLVALNEEDAVDSGTSDKVQGKSKEMEGQIQRQVGDGDEAIEGAAKEAEGKLQQGAGEAKNRADEAESELDDSSNSLIDAVKDFFGQ